MAKLIYNKYTQAIQELFGGDHKDIPTVKKQYKTDTVVKHGNALKLTGEDLTNYTKIYKLIESNVYCSKRNKNNFYS